MSLRGRTALVTGSSSGIGLGIARALARQQARIVLHGVEPLESLQAAARQLSTEADTEVYAVSADLQSAEAAAALVAAAQDRFGSVDILVNNAGIQHVAPIEEFSLAKWQAILAIHLTAAFVTTQKVLPGMRRKGWGRIINISSAHGLVASANKSAYVAAKHGLLGLNKVTALETAGSGVTCNAICPGWVKTPLVMKQVEERAVRNQQSLQDATSALLAEKQPSQHFVEVEQLGALVHFLCTEAAAQITGASLSMDGGWTAQ